MACLPKGYGAIVVFGVLEEVFRLDLVACPGALLRQQQVLLVAALQAGGRRVRRGGRVSAHPPVARGKGLV